MIQNHNEQIRQQPYFYWLVRIPGIGDRTIHRLLSTVESPEQIYYAEEKLLRAWKEEGILTQKQYYSLCISRKEGNLYTAYDNLQKAGIKIYPFYHSEFPPNLANIPDCPGALFVKGNLPDPKKKSLAIIGARSCSGYGKRMAQEFGEILGRAGVQIISGMARGVDGIGQEAALKVGGSSFGVLGCGVDICYPPQNRSLYEQLQTQGGVISSYLPGTKPQSQYFPPRNRIISGLADALLVIEAREKSGTLITVDMALEQGREVYALPGRVDDAISEGCNRLISQGAGIALSPEYLLEEMLGENVDCKVEQKDAAVRNHLTPEEYRVYEILDDYPKSFTAIWEELSGEKKDALPLPQVMDKLMHLCMKGYAQQLNGANVYIRKARY